MLETNFCSVTGHVFQKVFMKCSTSRLEAFLAKSFICTQQWLTFMFLESWNLLHDGMFSTYVLFPDHELNNLCCTDMQKFNPDIFNGVLTLCAIQLPTIVKNVWLRFVSYFTIQSLNINRVIQALEFNQYYTGNLFTPLMHRGFFLFPITIQVGHSFSI